MIPLHRPAFGVGAVLRAALFPRAEGKELRRCEAAHAAASGCAEAVWLPSARAGIAWALRAAINAETKVIGPAFTCSVVHEAMVRSGGKVQIVDAAVGQAFQPAGSPDFPVRCSEQAAGKVAAPLAITEPADRNVRPTTENTFAMPRTSLLAALTGNHALVLSEPYGHTCDLEQLAQASSSQSKIRIVDSAMAVPHPSLFARLHGNDFAVISFGTGKNMYAGWGAMGFTRDAALANEVRKFRDAMLAAVSFKLTLNRSLGIGLRTAAQNPLVFSATRKLWYQASALRSRLHKNSGAPQVAAAAQSLKFPAAWADDKTCSPEWRLPSTHVDRGLALRNLETAGAVHAKRLELARRYQKNLAGANGLLLPPVSPFALSHFTVRVDARIRNRVKEDLVNRGVYTISLWTFSPHLNPQEFPNAARLCAEVINLPLSPWMSLEQVDEVCERLVNVGDDVRSL